MQQTSAFLLLTNLIDQKKRYGRSFIIKKIYLVAI
jgi:hypothetical protein